MDTTMTINAILLVVLVACALATVMTARVLRSAVGLAVTSAVLAVLMFRLQASLAAVFELSVCAGLIPVIFISVIGMTQRLEPESLALRRRQKLRLYGLLPILVLVACGALLATHIPMDFAPPGPVANQDARVELWDFRHVDLIGQVAVLAAAAFGVVVLVKGDDRDE